MRRPWSDPEIPEPNEDGVITDTPVDGKPDPLEELFEPKLEPRPEEPEET